MKIKTLCVFEKDGIRLLDITAKHVREITKNEVLVKVLFTGICGTDIKLAEGMYPIAENLFPLTLGHEFVGKVTEIGSNVSGYSVGDHIVGKPTVQSCGTCTYCRSGKVNLCENRLRLGINTDGSFGEYIILQSHQLINVNSLKKPVSGAWLEPISVVARGINQLTLNPNFKVCVLGPGPIGVLSALLLKEFGLHVTMIGLESDCKRLQFLKDQNIVNAISIEHERSNLFDCIIDCTGNEHAINNGLRWIKPSSQFLLLGTNKSKMNIDFSLIVYKELLVTGTIGANELDWDYALEFLYRNEEILSTLAQIVPFEKVLEGFTSHNNVEPKTIIQF